MYLFKCLLIVCLLVFLGACASKPVLKVEDIDRGLTPTRVIKDATTYEGKKVLWGGIIIAGQNLEKTTRLELLTYPLDSNFKPDVQAKAYQRIFAIYEGYLETANLTPGRLLSVTGIFTGMQSGQIGEMVYDYPTLSVLELYLWPRPEDKQGDSRFHFGVGISIHN